MSTPTATRFTVTATATLVLIMALVAVPPAAAAASGTTSVSVTVSPAAVTLIQAERATAAERQAAAELLGFVSHYAEQLETQPSAEPPTTVLEQIGADSLLWIEGRTFRVDRHGVHEHPDRAAAGSSTAYSL